MMIKEYFINNLSKIENDWKRLEIGTEMTSFQTYDWSLLLLKDIKEKLLRSIFWKPVFVCHLNSNGEVDMIAPLVVQSKSLNLRFYSMMSGICILGEKSYSDYLNFIYNKWSDEAADEIFSFIHENYGGIELRLNNVLENSSLAGYVTNHFELINRDGETAVFVDNPVDADEYYKSLSKNTRQNIRTAYNRLAKNNFECEITMCDTIPDKATEKVMHDIHNDRFIKKNGLDGKFSIKKFMWTCAHKNNETRHNCVFTALKTLSSSWLLLIRINGEVAGYLCGLKDKDTYYVMQNSFSEKFREFSPGFLACYNLVTRFAGNNEIKCIDFTRGTEDYKYKLNGTEKRLCNFTFNI